MAFASGYYKTSYAADMGIVDTKARWAALGALLAGLLVFPGVASPFLLDLANQVFIALIAAVALMLLTGVAGQISLGTPV